MRYDCNTIIVKNYEPVVPYILLSSKKLSAGCLRLYIGVKATADGIFCQLNNETLSTHSGLSQRAVTDNLAKLNDLKLVKVHYEDIRVIEILNWRDSKICKPIKKRGETVQWEGREIELQKMLSDKQRHIQIIGLFIDHKKIGMDNKEQRTQLIGRYAKVAMQLKGYTAQQMADAMKKCDRDYKEIVWSLNTVLKVLTK